MRLVSEDQAFRAIGSGQRILGVNADATRQQLDLGGSRNAGPAVAPDAAESLRHDCGLHNDTC